MKISIETATTVVELLRNEYVLTSLKESGLTIDWKVLFNSLAEGVIVDWKAPQELLKPLDLPPYAKDKSVPTKPVTAVKLYSTSIREDIDSLRRITRDKGTSFDLLLDIVDRLERERPQFRSYPAPSTPSAPLTPPVTISPTPNTPWPGYPRPYIGDPVTPGMGTISSTINSGEAMGRVSAVSDATGMADEDIPF